MSKVSVEFLDKRIVSDFGLDLPAGKIQVLMGPNGSGKSSLSLALAGHPQYKIGAEAKVKLNGIDLKPLGADERAKLGLFLSFQTPVTIPGISVRQMMKIMVDHLRQEKVLIKDFLDELHDDAEVVGIGPELLERGINDGFSGGEKKRLEMLALLLCQPKYAIMDEIDSGLDVDAIKRITKAIRVAQNKFGTGFLMVTHYRRILEYLPVEAVHVLMKGKLVLSGGKEVINQIETDGYQRLG